MVRKWYRSLGGIAFIFGIQGSSAAEAWLLITSNLPEASVFIDDIYYGVTPRRSSDALRIEVSEGIQVIEIRKRINGRECAKKQIIEVARENQKLVQFSLCRKTASILVVPTALPMQDSEQRLGKVIPLGELKVPGRNF